jgi:hypothetical protein
MLFLWLKMEILGLGREGETRISHDFLGKFEDRGHKFSKDTGELRTGPRDSPSIRGLGQRLLNNRRRSPVTGGAPWQSTTG